MNHRQRISRRVMRHFLQLAAASFAIGANAGTASASTEDVLSADQQGESKYTQLRAPLAGQEAYPLSFALPAPVAGTLAVSRTAAIRVLDKDGRKLMQMQVDGASMVGPFDHGAYTLLIKANGLTEVHRLRIGTDTLPYLHFTESTQTDLGSPDNEA